LAEIFRIWRESRRASMSRRFFRITFPIALREASKFTLRKLTSGPLML
jgi:hypothetical protein